MTIIDTASRTVVGAVGIGAAGDTLTLGPDGSQLYITHQETQSVTVVDTATEQIAEISVADVPRDVTVTPDGSHAYVTCRNSVTAIDMCSEEMTPVVTGGLLRGLRISPDGKCCYIADFGAGTVSVVDTITNSVRATVAVGGCPEAMAVSADGERLYVGEYWRGAVTVISTPTLEA